MAIINAITYYMITYYLSGEHIIVEKYAKDLVVGGTVGAVTGPINLGGHRYTTFIASKVGSEGVNRESSS